MNDLKIAEQCIPKECKDDLVSRRMVYCLALASENGLEFGQALIDMPSAKPEIIRCKDCKQFRRWIDTDICFCDITESEISDNDFCSRAERRTRE